MTLSSWRGVLAAYCRIEGAINGVNGGPALFFGWRCGTSWTVTRFTPRQQLEHAQEAARNNREFPIADRLADTSPSVCGKLPRRQ
jgi:hypothetical protein